MDTPRIQVGVRGLGECLRQAERCLTLRRAALGETRGGTGGEALAGALLDAVTLFERLGIGYALVGGMAAMMYGRGKFTEDVDFVAGEGHEEVLAANGAAMRACGFDPGCTWKLHHRSGVEVDLWKDEHVKGILARAREVEMAGRKLRVAEANDLVAMKLRAGRLQDDYDIGEMIQAGTVEEGLLRGLVTEGEWGRFEGIKTRAKAGA